jgi:hypothetical protein
MRGCRPCRQQRPTSLLKLSSGRNNIGSLCVHVRLGGQDALINRQGRWEPFMLSGVVPIVWLRPHGVSAQSRTILLAIVASPSLVYPGLTIMPMKK